MTRAPGWLGRLLICMLITQVAIFVIRPVLTYRALDLGAGEREVGFLVVAFALLPALVALPMGRYSDRRRPGTVVQGGVVFLVAGCAGLLLANDLVMITAATVVLGLGALAVMMGAQALTARLSGEDTLDRDIGLITAAASLGQMIGPALAGLVLSADAERSITTTRAFVLGGALLCVALLTCWRFGDSRPRRVTGAPPPLRHGSIRIIRLPGVIGGMFVSVTLLTAVDLLVAYLPLLGEQRGISPGVVGLLLSARAAASVVSRVLIPSMLGRWGRTRLLWASTLATGGLLALLPLTEQIWLMASLLVLVGFFLGIGQPLTMSLVVQAVPGEARGAALSIRLMGNKIGQVVLPAGIALATGAAGVSSAFLLVGAVLVISAAGVPRQRPGPATPDVS